MPESSRSLARKAGAAAVEKTLETLMPALFHRLEQIDQRIAGLDREVHGIREHIDNRYDQMRDVMNELGQRMARVARAFQTFTEAVHRQSNKMDDEWIERLVRVEMTQATLRGKRAS
jgi:hypothetical protein